MGYLQTRTKHVIKSKAILNKGFILNAVIKQMTPAVSEKSTRGFSTITSAFLSRMLWLLKLFY